MKTYTVTKDCYFALRTNNKAEAEAKLKELQQYNKDWYICEQGQDDKDFIAYGFKDKPYNKV